MHVLARYLASWSPPCATHRAARSSGWALGLTLVLLTVHPVAAQVTLAWNPSPSVGVEGYRVYYGTHTHIYTASLDAGLATTATVPGLSNDQTYYFVVVAYNHTDGTESAVSNEVSTTLASGQVQGLVAAYSFNEGRGTTVIDVSGQGNFGTITGATWTLQGKFGSALSFTGSGNVIVPHSPTVNLTSSFTLSAWVKPTALSGYQTILIKEITSGCSYWLQTNGNQVSSGFNNGSGCAEHLTTTANLQLNTWSYLTAVFDEAANTYKIHVNGTLVSSQTETGTIQPNTESLVIGQSGCSSCGYERWRGLIDEVRIYNRALSPSEIQADMGTPISP